MLTNADRDKKASNWKYAIIDCVVRIADWYSLSWSEVA
jgi:hypothetical protein